MSKILIVLGGPLEKNCTPGIHLLERLKEAEKIHKNFNKIIVTGTNTQGYKHTEARVMAEWLAKKGIRAIREDFARNTIENAILTREMVPNTKGVTVTVLTNSFHIPRTSLIFIHSWTGYNLIFHSAPTIKNDITVENELRHLSYICNNISRINTVVPYRPPLLHRAIIRGDIDEVYRLIEIGENPYEKAEFTLWQGMMDCFGIVQSIDLTPVQSTIISLILMKKCNVGICTVRHAQTEANLNALMNERHKSYKKYDTILTEVGWKMVSKINAYIVKYNLLEGITVLVSPLKRTLDTCIGLTRNTNIKTIECFKDLAEKLNDFGDIGTNLNDLKKLYRNITFNFTQEEWWYRPDINNNTCDKIEAEPEESLQNRVDNFSKQIILDKKYLIVTHGGFIRKISGCCVKNCEAKLFSIQ